MSSRPRSIPPTPWWVLIFLPPFVIINGWIVEGALGYFLYNTPISPEILPYYIWWSRFDFIAKWLIAGVVARFLVLRQARLPVNSSGASRLKWFAPWLLTLLLLGLESWVRVKCFDTNVLTFSGKSNLVIISLPSPLIHDSAGSSFKFFSPTPSQVWWCGLRPLIAFLIATAVLLISRALVLKFRARLTSHPIPLQEGA